MLAILELLITKNSYIRRDRCAFSHLQSVSIHRFRIISSLFTVAVQERFQQLKKVISGHFVQLRLVDQGWPHVQKASHQLFHIFLF